MHLANQAMGPQSFPNAQTMGNGSLSSGLLRQPGMGGTGGTGGTGGMDGAGSGFGG